MTRARALALVCLFLLRSVAYGDEDIERMIEMYNRTDSEQRLRDYEELKEMRRSRGERHLPAGSQFDFSRESYRRMREQKTGVKDANGCAWTSAGPTNLNGRVISIAVDPGEPKRIYAATVGGLWKSETAGRRWQRVSDDILADRFGAVAVNPYDTSEVFAAVGDPNMGVSGGGGMWRSNSYGAPGTWNEVLPQKFNFANVYRIRIDPDKNNNDVYVAASNGVWIGKHQGGTVDFTRISGFNAHASDVAVDFVANPHILYAGVRVANASFERGIYKWVSNQWFKKSNGIDTSDSDAITIALAKSKPWVLYAKVAQKSDDSLVGIFRTDTSAEQIQINKPAWKLLPLGAPDGPPDEWGWYPTMLEVDPIDDTRVYAGGTHLWMSTISGEHWDDISIGSDLTYPLESHADVHALAFDPANPKIIYVGNDGGIDRADLSNASWHWVDVSHGMIITMFWTLTSNRAYPSLLAGGLQDNGTSITFGNRTWYQPGGGDGYDVGSDAGNPDALYSRGNNVMYETLNPTPGSAGGYDPNKPPGNGPVAAWFGNKPIAPPMITDVSEPHSALAAGGPDCGTRTIAKTVDGENWTKIDPGFPQGGAVVALASAPSDHFKTYLAAVAYREPAAPCIPPATPPNPFVIRLINGGTQSITATGLPATKEPLSLEFDPKNSLRSYVTYKNGIDRIFMTTDGTAYTSITGTSSDAIKGEVRHVAVDPDDANILYAATSVGVFRGEINLSNTPPTAKWAPFDEGLPDGLEINGIWVDPTTKILTIGTFGFGAFRRNIDKSVMCEPRMLVVRDTVYDDGREPSESLPDAEHPIQDFPSQFYKPDDTTAGMAAWWSSRDIRIDVPSNDPPANKIADADSVEFELCPTSVVNCPAGAMLDSAPKFHKDARVYVQVTNRGVEAAPNAKVIALWNPSSAAFENLPETFWTKTFPLNDKCGDLDPGTGWQLVDPKEPCRTIAPVTPEMPELARFDWAVPLAADGGATMLTIVESPDDPLDPSIRADNRRKPFDIVPNSRHIALRSEHATDFDLSVRVPFLWPLDLLHLPGEMSEVEVVVSKPDLRDSVRIVLPAGLTAHAGIGIARQTRITEEELVRQLESMKLDPNNAWEFSGDEASLFVDLRPGQRITTGVIATPPADTRTTSRVSIVERSRGKIFGGNVMLLRPRM